MGDRCPMPVEHVRTDPVRLSMAMAFDLRVAQME